ncbi:McrB family protein [Shewanella oncorhynchi]|uniref:McrB family protein n=1 Tax=Shewanella oncorhynchi TaxID=2726434 RepID=UPI003D78B643
MIDLNEYFSLTSESSKFSCSLGRKGGFVNFSNSGQRGSVKEFTLSLDSILSGLKDIKDNLDIFQSLTRYVEKDWRDNGSNYFNDLILNSMITVQTKPCFTTFSKIISWANNVEYSSYDDNKIDLTETSLDKAIQKLEDLSLSFTPSTTHLLKHIRILESESIVLLPKPFVLLAGISGTGKSRFVRKQAQYTGDGKTNFELVSVRPDWHEPSDLLGYVSRLSSDGAEYVVTNVLKFMVRAWLDIIENVDADSWSQKPFSQIRPFWLCLDEMNLAPVEQYFADYLSVIETREWKDGEYSCDPLLKKDVFEQLKEPALTKLQQDLGLKKHDELWKYFINHGIAIPFNLVVAGTVNMDETTHGFSRKVIDRALSFDFGEFFPNAVEEFFDETLKPKALSYPLFSHAKFEQFEKVAADSDATKTKAFFNAINSMLKNTPFELAYRAFNELCLAVISFAPNDDIELAAVFDDFLMCKVLPRIEGDDDKLMGSTGQNLLEQLSSVLESQLAVIWDQERPDLLREKRGFPDEVISIPCRSRTKLDRMNQLLARGFTSFWP